MVETKVLPLFFAGGTMKEQADGSVYRTPTSLPVLLNFARWNHAAFRRGACACKNSGQLETQRYICAPPPPGLSLRKSVCIHYNKILMSRLLEPDQGPYDLRPNGFYTSGCIFVVKIASKKNLQWKYLRVMSKIILKKQLLTK